MIVTPGATSQSITIQIVDDSGLAVTGLVAATFPATYYLRAGETLPASVTLSNLAAQNSAYSSGGVKELTGGYYRFDVPDAAFATASKVRIVGEASGKHILCQVITVAELPANVRQLLGTAWLTPAVPGTPDVNVKQLSGDAVAADNAEAFFDGTGYAGTNNVIPTATNLTNLPAIPANWLTAAGIATDAFTAAKFAADCITAAKIADGAIDTATFASGTTIPRVTLADTVTTYTGNTPQTGDNFARIGATGSGLTSLAPSATALTSATWTNARAGYLDNLNVGGNVASSAEAVAIQNNTRVVRVVPDVIERPDSGTTTYRVELLLYDTTGNMEAPDSAPTLALVNQAGTDRSGRLDSTTGALVSAGRYRWIYTADVADTLEQLVWTFSVVEGGNTRLYGNTSLIVDTSAVDFTAADRTKLETLAADYTTARSIKLDNLDAAITTRMATYVQPTGFLAATFPNGTIANTTNITAGTLTTVTNVTTVNGLAANTVTAAALAGDAVTEIQSGLATAAALDTVDDFLDTEVAAIKLVTDHLATALELDGAVYRFTTNALELAPTGAGGGLDAAGMRAAIGLATANLDTQFDALPTNAELAARTLTAASYALEATALAVKTKTDQLTFTVALQLDANIQYVNNVQVIGTGTSGDPWGPP